MAPDYLAAKRAFLERARRDSRNRSTLEAAAAVRWRNIGPFEGDRGDPSRIDSGRLRVIVTHPTDPKIIYVGTAGGGVWKTSDADLAPGATWTWTPLTDGIAAASASGNIAVGGLAMSPADPETLYLGLGDPFQSGEARGFFITHDGGATWNAGGDPGNTAFIFTMLAIGSSGVLVGGSDGLWRSTDGGRSFTRVAFRGSSGQGEFIYSLARYADGTLLCSRAGSGGIERSTDGGVTWTVAPLPQNPLLGRLTLATSGSTAWALAADSMGSLQSGLFKSTDQGKSWVWVPSGATTFPDWQGSYNQMLAVDPDVGVFRRFLTGPRGCEITGFHTTPDNRSAFVNIQHPGETPGDRSNPDKPNAFSNWPDFAPNGRPRSATVVIRRKDGGIIGT
jgi:hypothetical protein